MRISDWSSNVCYSDLYTIIRQDIGDAHRGAAGPTPVDQRVDLVRERLVRRQHAHPVPNHLRSEGGFLRVDAVARIVQIPAILRLPCPFRPLPPPRPPHPPQPPPPPTPHRPTTPAPPPP